jgi:hypothetical protein
MVLIAQEFPRWFLFFVRLFNPLDEPFTCHENNAFHFMNLDFCPLDSPISTVLFICLIERTFDLLTMLNEFPADRVIWQEWPYLQM